MGTHDWRAMPATSAGAGRQTVADITTTTTEEKNERMINPTEQKLQRYWDQIQRALQALQQAQPHDLYQDSAGATMRAARLGDWIPIDDVVKAIQILQEGQQ